MRHEWTQTVVDGFASGETDFLARLAAADQSVRDDVDNLIMSPLINAVDGAVLVIQGHSDRVDTGQDHATCLDLEANASKDRANSAFEGLLALVGRDWLSPPPMSWADLPNVAIAVSPQGAVMLADRSGTDAGRLRNRRVYLAVCRFIADE